MLSGIDISKWQAGNYKNYIDKYAKDFVIVRAAWRKTVDPYCDQMYQYAKSKGKKLGYYFFPLTSDGDPKSHANWAYKQVLGYIGEAIPILDWERYSGAEGLNDDSNTTWALNWLDEFYRLSGTRPMIYMNSNCNASYNWQSVASGNYGLWIANYGRNTGVDSGRPSVKYWKSAAMHQYTSNLGNTSLDGDSFYGDKTAWDAYAKTSQKVNDQSKEDTREQVREIAQNLVKDLKTAREYINNLQVESNTLWQDLDVYMVSQITKLEDSINTLL